MYPTPPRNMKRKLSFSADHSAAKVVRRSKPTKVKHVGKAAKRFEKRVLKVLKEPTATGKYTQTITTILQQTDFNLYSIYNLDYGNGTSGAYQRLEFFSPRQFKDAEAVLFNQKPAAYNSFATIDVEAGGNFPHAETTKVNNSSATFRFKNVSQHKSIVEMYICKGKDGTGSEDPHNDWAQCLRAGQTFEVNGITTLGADHRVRNTHVHMNGLEPFDRMWNVTKVVFKFEPGEEAFHMMKGPRSYMMDGAKKQIMSAVAPDDSVWKGPQNAGCGSYVFFRILNNLTLCTSTEGSHTGGHRTAVCHPPHHWQNNSSAIAIGGIAVEITRHYNIEAPMGVPVLMNNREVINTNYGNPAGTVFDVEVEADDPSTIPSIPQ